MKTSVIENKRMTVFAVAVLIGIILIALFLCFASVFTSYGYAQTLNADVRIRITEALNSDETNRLRIVIDPGHGGEDPGAVTDTVKEKDLNLSVGLNLYDFLSLSGNEIVLTRDGDYMLSENAENGKKKSADLKNRLGIAQRTANSVYVGIHMNKFPIEKYRGAQVFYSENNEKSASLAEYIREYLLYADSENKREIKNGSDTIFILEQSYIPAVLVECGFISNPNEAELLCDERYRKKLAFLIYCAIEKYTDENINKES